MRDAAWEFFARHLAQNPKMADTFSGVILVMQAHGLYMLKVPKLVHDGALVPLGTEISRLRDETAEPVNRHAEATRDNFAICEKNPASRRGRGHGGKGTRRSDPRRLARSEYRKAGGKDSGGDGNRPFASARRAMPPTGRDDSRPERCRRTN